MTLTDRIETPPADRNPRYAGGRIWGVIIPAALTATVALGGMALVMDSAKDREHRAASCAQAITAANEISTLSRYNWAEAEQYVNAGWTAREDHEAGQAIVNNLEAVVHAREVRLEALQATYNTHRKDCTA